MSIRPPRARVSAQAASGRALWRSIPSPESAADEGVGSLPTLQVHEGPSGLRSLSKLPCRGITDHSPVLCRHTLSLISSLCFLAPRADGCAWRVAVALGAWRVLGPAAPRPRPLRPRPRASRSAACYILDFFSYLFQLDQACSRQRTRCAPLSRPRTSRSPALPPSLSLPSLLLQVKNSEVMGLEWEHVVFDVTFDQGARSFIPPSLLSSPSSSELCRPLRLELTFERRSGSWLGLWEMAIRNHHVLSQSPSFREALEGHSSIV